MSDESDYSRGFAEGERERARTLARDFDNMRVESERAGLPEAARAYEIASLHAQNIANEEMS